MSQQSTNFASVTKPADMNTSHHTPAMTQANPTHDTDFLAPPQMAARNFAPASHPALLQAPKVEIQAPAPARPTLPALKRQGAFKIVEFNGVLHRIGGATKRTDRRDAVAEFVDGGPVDLSTHGEPRPYTGPATFLESHPSVDTDAKKKSPRGTVRNAVAGLKTLFRATRPLPKITITPPAQTPSPSPTTPSVAADSHSFLPPIRRVSPLLPAVLPAKVEPENRTSRNALEKTEASLDTRVAADGSLQLANGSAEFAFIASPRPRRPRTAQKGAGAGRGTTQRPPRTPAQGLPRQGGRGVGQGQQQQQNNSPTLTFRTTQRAPRAPLQGVAPLRPGSGQQGLQWPRERRDTATTLTFRAPARPASTGSRRPPDGENLGEE